MVVQHSCHVLRGDSAWATLPSEVADELHLKGLEVVAGVLVLIVSHLLLIHGIISHHVSLLSSVVEQSLQVLRQLHLVVHLTKWHLGRLRLPIGSELSVMLLATAHSA